MAESPMTTKSSVVITDEKDDAEAGMGVESASARCLTPLQTMRQQSRETLWCLYAIFILVLGGFDNQAGGAVLSIPEFRKDFGSPYEGNYVLPAVWQSAYSGGPVLSYVTVGNCIKTRPNKIRTDLLLGTSDLPGLETELAGNGH